MTKDNPKTASAGINNVKFGNDVTVVEPVNLYGCDIGANSFIGPFVEIQKNVTIGEYVKIQSHSFICELVTIGDHCFIGHGVMFVNDSFSNGGPARGDNDHLKPCFDWIECHNFACINLFRCCYRCGCCCHKGYNRAR